MFYDAKCRLCNTEVKHYRRLDKHRKVKWIDFTEKQERLAQFGITYDQAMARLHAVDAQGNVQSGVKAFIIVWKQLPWYRLLAWFIDRLHLTFLLERIYSRFADWRLKHRCGRACASYGNTSMD
jgi:predicted DCC family thiol-disulfide oxidoreductase YuxK